MNRKKKPKGDIVYLIIICILTLILRNKCIYYTSCNNSIMQNNETHSNAMKMSKTTTEGKKKEKET